MSAKRFSLHFVLIIAVSLLLIACGSEDLAGQNEGEEIRQNQNQNANQSENQSQNQSENHSQNQSENQSQSQNQSENQSENQSQNQSQNQNDSNPPIDCEASVDRSAQFEIPTDGAPAYFARAAYADELIWVSYVAVTEVDDQNVEKAHLVRIGCNGEVLSGPQMIGVDTPIRDYHTAIVADDETVFVVWVMETATGQELYGRTYDVDGTPRQAEPFRIVVLLKTDDTVGTIWKPSLAITPEGNAVMAVEGLTLMDSRVLIQRFDGDGELVGYGFFVNDSAMHGGQTDPVVTVLEDGTIHFAYVGGEFAEGQVYVGTVAPGGDEPDSTPVAAHHQPTISQSVSYSQDHRSLFTWMTYPLGAQIPNSAVVRDGTVVGPSQLRSTNVPDRVSNFIDAAASHGGGAIAWMSYATTPNASRIHFQRFGVTGQGGIGEMGQRVDQHTTNDARWPYGPSIVWLFDEVYAAVWVEHDGYLRVRGRIIDLQ